MFLCVISNLLVSNVVVVIVFLKVMCDHEYKFLGKICKCLYGVVVVVCWVGVVVVYVVCLVGKSFNVINS